LPEGEPDGAEEGEEDDGQAVLQAQQGPEDDGPVGQIGQTEER
jgi:hypothetical protein